MSHQVKLFCFPFAGGSASYYLKWKKNIHPSIEVCSVELAGRGARMRDDFYRSTDAMVDDLCEKILKQINGTPYAMFGHSLGGITSFLLAKKLKENNYKEPVHLFISGRNPPHIPRVESQRFHILADNVFKEKVLNLGGIPQDIAAYPELLDFFLPIMKNDFALNDYFMEITASPLNCNISVFKGEADDLATKCELWNSYTTGNFVSHSFEGGHFFINEHTNKIIDLVNTSLLN
jgi:medium-chain acyl-[acyl-carrier-protein] hydrolase